ncbi:hypothetical protein KWV57_02990, partial [Clostridioides difficile]|nr:hypothetical protein [Clostridioides difficile]
TIYFILKPYKSYKSILKLANRQVSRKIINLYVKMTLSSILQQMATLKAKILPINKNLND